MSRVTILEQLYGTKNKKSALDFNYDILTAPPIMSIFCQEDINKLYKIATSLRYNADIQKKYDLIDEVMKSRGFRRAHCGTNRVVYESIYDTTFVAKVAVDKVGIKDSPAEFKNQEFFKPFCCKIFEVDPTGVLAFVERVNPITSLEEFLSVADDIFNMMVTKIIGKYVVDDLGTDKYMNYGLRYNSYTGHTFGPVIIDFPYAYELDGAKLICQKPIGNIPCGGEIDYDIGFNNLICTKCGRKYTALDLKKNTSNILIIHDGGDKKMRVRIKKNDKVYLDSGLSSKTYITKEDFDNLQAFDSEMPIDTPITVSKKKMLKRKSNEEYYNKYFVDPQIKFFEQFKPKATNTKIVKVNKNLQPNNTILENTQESKYGITVKVSKVINSDTNQEIYNLESESSENIPLKEDTIIVSAEPIVIDEPIDKSVTTIQENENIFSAIPQNIIDNRSEDNVVIQDSVIITDNTISDNGIPITNEEDEKSKNDDSSKYVSILDYHGEDDNYYQKQRRANKRKDKKKHNKYRNRGFNNYDDDDINNF